MITRKKNIWPAWLIVILIVTILRIYITADRDILALNSPHDEYWYIKTAFNKIWGGSYDQMAFIHLPVYSIWLGFLKFLGVSTRIGIDVGWLMASTYLAFAIFNLTRAFWLSFFLYVFLAFHPYTITIFDRTLAETLLAVICTAVIGAGIELWNTRHEVLTFRRIIALITYVIGFAVAFFTRKEGVVLVVPILGLVILSAFDRQRWWKNGRKKLAIPLLIAPFFSIFLLGFVLAGGNYLKWGVMAAYELAAPGYQRTIAALNRIDVGRTPKHFTVTQEVLSSAYKASPTLSELQQFMANGVGQMWVSISSQNTGVNNEIGNGWFFWALRDVAAQAGWHKDAVFAESKYASVADELERAIDAGQLKTKGITISSFLDPDFGKWLPDLPRSIINVSQLVLGPKIQDLKLPIASASPIQLSRYITITGNRVESSGIGQITGVNGWIKMPVGSSVGLSAGNTVVVSTSLSGQQRPDVLGAYPFSLLTDGDQVPTELQVTAPDGQKGSVKLNMLNPQQAISISVGAVKIDLGIDSLKYSGTYRADKWLPSLCFIYQYIGYIFCVVTLLIITLFILGQRLLRFTPVVVIFLGATLAIATRIMLFGIIDASSFSAIQARYMLPIIPVFLSGGILGVYLLSRVLFENRKSGKMAITHVG